MRIAVSFLLILVAFTSVIGQESEVRQVGTFKGVKVGEAINVTLKKGDKESVKVKVEGVSPKAVITEISGSYLRIHMADGSYKNRKVNVDVTYVSLEKISAASASSIVSDGVIKAAGLDISASSAASIEITIDAGAVTADVGSAGDIRLEGKAKSVTVDASSAGVFDAYDLECEMADASASSAGTIKVNASKEIRAEASSAGSIRYRGNPSKSDTKSSSGGSVRKTE